MNIRFISTLTADDENKYAKALLRAVSSLLDQSAMAYTIRIETCDGTTLQHSHSADEADTEQIPGNGGLIERAADRSDIGRIRLTRAGSGPHS